MPKVASKARNKHSRQTQTHPNNPKGSHLYTDDNPATTLHGTGFKDRAAAEHTLELIQNRSLTYQFQTVNTMFHRAKHHPSMKNASSNANSTKGMREAMGIFRHWLDVTYVEDKAAAQAGEFKPMLSKRCVERFLPAIEESPKVSTIAKTFAAMYVALPKGKRLANMLVDDSRPTEADWERKRCDILNRAVSNGKETKEGWDDAELFEAKLPKRVTDQHLELIAFAWSPVPEKRLT